MDGKPSFDEIFRLMGYHLGAAALGFVVAAWIFAPKPRQPAALSPRVVQILELRAQAHSFSTMTPDRAPASVEGRAGTAGAPGSANAASAVPVQASPVLARATELCKALGWPACDPDSVRAMGKLP